MRWYVPVVVSPRLTHVRRVECDGFYQGAHNGDLDVGLDEIDAYFERKSAELNKSVVHAQKRLEAKLEHVRQSLPSVEQVRGAVQSRVGDRTPPVVMPLLIAIIGVLAITAEALLLAPAMDLLGVTQEEYQLVSAFGLAASSGLLYHFGWLSITADRTARAWRLVCRILAALLTAGLVCWGILRGYQVAYAAELVGNPLGAFIGAHPVLSAAFYVLITLAAPVVGAAAAHFAADELHVWREWRTTKSRVEKLRAARTSLEKRLEGLQQGLACGVQALSEERKRFRALYEQNYVRGRAYGAVQEPYWLVIVRATVAALIASIAVGWAALLYPPATLAIPLFWIIAFLFYRQQWNSPGPIHFFNLERVQFFEAAGRRGPGPELQQRSPIPTDGVRRG